VTYASRLERNVLPSSYRGGVGVQIMEDNREYIELSPGQPTRDDPQAGGFERVANNNSP
jgi:hypothetical protein